MLSCKRPEERRFFFCPDRTGKCFFRYRPGIVGVFCKGNDLLFAIKIIFPMDFPTAVEYRAKRGWYPLG